MLIYDKKFYNQLKIDKYDLMNLYLLINKDIIKENIWKILNFFFKLYKDKFGNIITNKISSIIF